MAEPKRSSFSKRHRAEKPGEIPKKGWKEIGKRIFSQLQEDHVQIVSAGVAFYFFLALFPMIVAAISVYGLVLSPSQIQQHITELGSVLPSEAYKIIQGIMEPMLDKPSETFGWGLALSLLISLWSANKGTSALFEGINIAYNERDERGFLKKTGLSLLFTFGGILIGLISILIVILFPAFVEWFGFSSFIENLLSMGRWILLGALIVFSIALLYKFAPHRDNPQYKWVSWGAVAGTVLWIGGSLLFSWYVQSFGSYDDMYGSFAAVIILLMWLFLTSFIVLLGAEINSEMEHQTYKDTTIGEKEPMGQRGAYHADHVARGEKK